MYVLFKVTVGELPRGIVVPLAMVNVDDVQLYVRLMVTGVTNVYPEASTVVLAARPPSRVSVIFAGYVDVGLMIKLPLIVKVGLEANVRVALLLFVTLPKPISEYALKSGVDTFGKLNVPELVRLPLKISAVAVPEIL